MSAVQNELVAVHRNVVEGEMFGFPVPGKWPGGRGRVIDSEHSGDDNEPEPQVELVRRLGRLLLRRRV